MTQLRKKMLEELPLSICRFWILFGIEPGARTSIQAHVPSSFSHEGAVTARTPFCDNYSIQSQIRESEP